MINIYYNLIFTNNLNKRYTTLNQCFFFQAEDGIRDRTVTGVQTCALPIFPFNDAADLDHDGDIVRMPCEAANAICAAATGPTGAAGVNGPWENVDARALYSAFGRDRKSTRLNSSHRTISYAVFCLKKKTNI